jgi:DNA-directed RNA polymerase specialized sigma24 family protein
MQPSGSDPWPPLAIGAMIADMEQNTASPHWARTLQYVQSCAERLVLPYLGYEFEPGDLTQNVMLALQKPGKLANLRLLSTTGDSEMLPPRAFLRYLRGTTHFTFKDMLRPVRRRAKRRLDHHVESNADPPDEQDPLDLLASPSPTVEEQAVMTEKLAEVIRFLRELAAKSPDDARNVGELLRSVFTSEEYQRIAEEFGRDPNAVRMDIFRVRQKVRRAFSHHPRRGSGKAKSQQSNQTPTRKPSNKVASATTPPRPRQRRRAQPGAAPAPEAPLLQALETTLPSAAPIAPAAQLPSDAPASNHHTPVPSADETTSLETTSLAQPRKGQETQ